MPRIVPPRVARYSQEALECLAQGHRGRRATETPAHAAEPEGNHAERHQVVLCQKKSSPCLFPAVRQAD